MPDVLKTISKAHTQYKLASGTKVPGVTTVLSLLNKPALVKWANNLGLQGIDSNKYRDAAADIGTLAHAMIQAHLQNEKLDTSQYSAQQIDLAENGMVRRKIQKRKYRLVFMDNVGGMLASLAASFLYQSVKDIVDLSVVATQPIKTNNILNFNLLDIFLYSISNF